MAVFFKGKAKFQHLEIVPGGSLLGGDNYSLGAGRTFYVDRNGSDSRDGTSPNAPLKTITAAIAKCVAARYDAVVTMDESPSSPTAGETWPININKQGVLLTGLYSRGLISDSGFGSTPANTGVITIGAEYVNVENLYLQCLVGTTTADIIGITSGIARYGFTLRNCWLGMQTPCRYGFYSGDSADWPYLLIEDNIFSSTQGDYMTNAIRIVNSTFGMIRRNIFNYCSSYAILGLANGGNYSILDNKFMLSADTAGFAIQLNADTSNIFVDGNHAASKEGATAVTVYTDSSTTDNNHWGLNYAGIVAVLAT